MTGLPAATVGLVDWGLLAAGMAADVVVFDPVTVIDHATFEAPTLQSEGIRAVAVNGQFALRDGRPTGQRAGQALRRTNHMPTRPMNGSETRAAARRMTSSQHVVVMDVTQRPRARRPASGTFRVTEKATGVTPTMTEFGQLQTALRFDLVHRPSSPASVGARACRARHPRRRRADCARRRVQCHAGRPIAESWRGPGRVTLARPASDRRACGSASLVAVSFCPASGGRRKLDSVSWNSGSQVF